MLRDIEERGRSIQSIHQQYLTTVKPMHEAFIEPSKKYADLIIPEGGHNEVGIQIAVDLDGKIPVRRRMDRREENGLSSTDIFLRKNPFFISHRVRRSLTLES